MRTPRSTSAPPARFLPATRTSSTAPRRALRLARSAGLLRAARARLLDHGPGRCDSAPSQSGGLAHVVDRAVVWGALVRRRVRDDWHLWTSWAEDPAWRLFRGVGME